MTKPRDIASWLPALIGPHEIATEDERYAVKRSIWRLLGNVTVTDVPDHVDDEGNTIGRTDITFAGGAGPTGLLANTDGGTIDDVATTDAATYAGVRFNGGPTVSGLAGGIDGRTLVVVAADAAVTLSNEGVGSASENRIITGTGAAVTVPIDGGALLVYDATDNDSSGGRWRIVAMTSSVGGSAATPNYSVQYRKTDGTFGGMAHWLASSDGYMESRTASETVASAGHWRVGYNSGGVSGSVGALLVAKDDVGTDRRLISLSSTAFTFGNTATPWSTNVAGPSLVFQTSSGNAAIFNLGYHYFYNGSSQEVLVLGGTSILSAFPRFGRDTAWGASEGEVTIANTGSYSLTSVQYMRASHVFSGAGTGTFTYPAPSADQTYFKFLQETGGYDKVITNGSGTTYTLLANTAAWVKITNNGVYPCATSGGGEANTVTNVGAGSQLAKAKVGVDIPLRTIVAGSGVTVVQNTNDVTISASGGGGSASVGTSGQVNVSDGAGGWTAPTNVFGGSSYFTVGVSGSPTTNGVRLANNYALSFRTSGASDVTGMKLDASDNMFVGSTTGIASLNVDAPTGASVNLRINGSTKAFVSGTDLTANVPVLIPGSNYISIGSSPPNTGWVRVAALGTGTVLSITSSGGSTYAAISFFSTNSLLFGNTSLPTYIAGTTIRLTAGGTEHTRFDPSNAYFGNPISYSISGTVAAAGWHRFGNNPGAIITQRNGGNSADLCALALTGSDVYIGSSTAGNTQNHTNVWIYPSTKVALGLSATSALEIVAENISIDRPLIGLVSPYSAHGRVAMTITSSRSLSTSEYARQIWEFTSTGTYTVTVPAPSDDDHSYWKLVTITGSGGEITISTGSGATATVTTAAASKCLVLITPAGCTRFICT